jgi:hypothetical protein
LISIIFESRGGTRGTATARNTEYATGLRILLKRLAAQDYRLVDAILDTGQTRARPIEDRRLQLEKVGDYPIDLRSVEPERLQRAISRAQGNNPTRRIRITIEPRASGRQVDSLLELLAHG